MPTATIPVTIRVTQEVYERLLAHVQGSTINAWGNEAILEKLEREEAAGPTLPTKPRSKGATTRKGEAS